MRWMMQESGLVIFVGTAGEAKRFLKAFLNNGSTRKSSDEMVGGHQSDTIAFEKQERD